MAVRQESTRKAGGKCMNLLVTNEGFIVKAQKGNMDNYGMLNS